ncbi:MAG: hypothetical protein HDT38_01160 [Clostridiales bacterium]|nr:hypothetical protein [Clostridiales bacterium]
MDRAGHGAHGGIAAAGWPRAIFYLVQFTWGLPVNLAGLLVFLCCRARFPSKRFHNSIVTYLPGNRGGLSLGVFIFLSVPSTAGHGGLCAHEYGHTVQCLFLGPLYWIVIAAPSVIWYHFFGGYREKHHISYDSLYCERWATAWGRKWSGMGPCFHD